MITNLKFFHIAIFELPILQIQFTLNSTGLIYLVRWKCVIDLNDFALTNWTNDIEYSSFMSW